MDSSQNIDVLEKDALFMITDFLTAEFLSNLVSEISEAKQYHTPLIDLEDRIAPSDKIPGRPNAVFEIPKPLHERLEKEIAGVKPEIERAFSIQLADMRHLYYSVYQSGDFIGRHADASPHTDEVDGVRTPKVIIIIFVNDQLDDDYKNESISGYTGGELTIYGLIKNKTLKDFGYPLRCKAGTLVAFRAECLHEVAEVISGTRYVANARFY